MFAEATPVLDGGSTAWLLASAALVFLMVPGVGFFYGGMVRSSNVLGTIAQSFAALAVVAVTWVVVGFSLAFGAGNPFVGGISFAGLRDLSLTVPGIDMPGVPLLAFVFFQMMFAIITPALITGGVVERWRFGAFTAFLALWSLAVYAPVAHWLFSPLGWGSRAGAQDFAGGAVVHMNAGAATLACVLVLGPRSGYPARQGKPHNLPLMLLGAALLWFGWFGFNGGSALSAGSVAALACVNSQLAAATGLLGWALVERIRVGRSTTVGIGSGAISGLVAITPAAGYVSPVSAMVIGLLAGTVCQLAVGLKSLLRLDDSLDVAAVHLVGGALGALCVGVFASHDLNPKSANGLLSGGGYHLLGAQARVVGAVAVYTFVVTWLLAQFTKRLLGNRVTAREEQHGLDLTQHGERAYDFDPPAPDVPRRRPGAPPVGLIARPGSNPPEAGGR